MQEQHSGQGTHATPQPIPVDDAQRAHDERPLPRAEQEIRDVARVSQADGAEGSTGMGDFADGEFQGGVGGDSDVTEPSGYGQDGDLRGGYGQGSGYAQSSADGGYGQGAEPQQEGQASGADQHEDERYSRFDAQGTQRRSPHGYGGRGPVETDGESTATTDDADTPAADDATAAG